MLKSSIFPDFVVIFADFHEICSDFLRFSRKTLQLLEISRFQFNFSMIIPDIHLIFDLIFDLILFNFTFNFHVGTTPCSWIHARGPPSPATRGSRESHDRDRRFWMCFQKVCASSVVPVVRTLVERFDRRGTEPFELFRSEFGQNTCKIKEFYFSQKIQKIKSGNFNIC